MREVAGRWVYSVSVRSRLPSNAVAGFPGDSLASRSQAFVVVPSPSSTYGEHSFRRFQEVDVGVSVLHRAR